MKYEYEGTVKQVGETRAVSANFSTREIVFASGTENYPTGLPMEATRDDVAKLDGIAAGDRVKVGFFLDGSKPSGNGRYFLRARVVDVTVVAKATGAATGAGASDAATADTGKAAWEAWIAWKPGDDAANRTAFADFCKGVCPKIAEAANLMGQKFSQVAATNPGTWAACVKAIADAKAKTVAGGAQSQSTDDDDMPF